MSSCLAAGLAAAQPRDPIVWVPGSTVFSANLVISADGRYVAWSEPSVPIGGLVNAYVHDRVTGTTTPLALPARGAPPEPIADVRPYGFYRDFFGTRPIGLVVTTDAQLLFDADFVCMQPAEDCNSGTDAYRVPIAGGLPDRVSVLDDEQEAPFGGVSFGAGAAVGLDGRIAAFVGDRLVLPDDNGFQEVYVRNTVSATTTRITRSMTGGDPDGPVKPEIAISPDGQVVAFVSRAGNLVAGDGNTTWDAFVYNRPTRVIERVSVRSDETEVRQPSGDVGFLGAQVSLSFDGRYVAFMSAANDLAPGDMNTSYDIFVRDRMAGETYLVTGDPRCGVRTGSNTNPTISHDGTTIAFATFDPCYSSHPTSKQAAVVNRLTRETAEVSVPIGGAAPDGQIDIVALGGFGDRVVFDSTATNISMTPPTSGGPRHVYTTTPFRDRDGDGLLDAWEESGIDVGGDGSVDLDLPALGATPDHKDVFVEIDWLAAGDHSHRPSAIALRQIEEAFAAAPVMNPDGRTGVRLHLLPSDEIPETAANAEIDALFFRGVHPIKAMYFGDSGDRLPGLEPNLVARRLAFRYLLMGHRQLTSSSSGQAETPGNDLIVTLGGFASLVGTVDQQAGTIMHELGHSLGLEHGGRERDWANCKPNYLSVMNYAFQFPVLLPGRPLDYSRGELLTLDESGLDERLGINGPSGSFTVFGPPRRSPLGEMELVTFPADRAIDWNADGDDGMDPSVAANVNDFEIDGCTDPPAPELLLGHDDWPVLVYNFRRTGGFSEGASPEDDFPVEMTRETYDALVALAPGPPNAPPVAVVGAPVTVDEGADVVLDGSGSSDPEGAPITFTWLQATGPEGMLAAADTAMPEFTAPQVDEDTALEIELAVHDGAFYSVPVWQRVTVIDRGGPPADGGPGGDGGDGDGGEVPDGGAADAGGGGGGGGCGCRTAGGEGPATPLAIAFMMLVLAGWTRRRRA